MTKFLILLLLPIAVLTTEIVLDVCGMGADKVGLADGNNEGIPDSDPSESSEDDVKIDSQSISISLIVSNLALPVDDYKYSFKVPDLEIPYPPPEEV